MQNNKSTDAAAINNLQLQTIYNLLNLIEQNDFKIKNLKQCVKALEAKKIFLRRRYWAALNETIYN